MPLGYNRVLGDPSIPEANRPHRVALASWPASVSDPRTQTLDALLGHVAASGYEGVEMGIPSFARYFPEGTSPAVIAAKVLKALEDANLRNFGTTLHITDEALRARNWLSAHKDQMKLTQDMGGEFIGLQFFIHPDYANTGGAYRDDDEYIAWCADKVAQYREACWSLGLNFYLEVHVDRITEDPAGLCRILDQCTVELNGDLSHYLARGFTRGKHVERILKLVNHTHVRMARKYGDLSAAVENPRADWNARGVTWQLFEFMKPALAHGLSSRTISGETGPMHLVKDTLTQDASLVPLYRAMARYADAGAQGIVLKVNEPADLQPWG